jgi:hypothetical protein
VPKAVITISDEGGALSVDLDPKNEPDAILDRVNYLAEFAASVVRSAVVYQDSFIDEVEALMDEFDEEYDGEDDDDVEEDDDEDDDEEGGDGDGPAADAVFKELFGSPLGDGAREALSRASELALSSEYAEAAKVIEDLTEQ